MWLFLILIHISTEAWSVEPNSKKKTPVASVTTAPKSKAVTLPAEVGAELTKKATDCDRALQALNGTINGGPGCAAKALVKEQGKEQQEKILDEMRMKGPPVLDYEAKSDKREIKGNTTQVRDLSGEMMTISVLTPEEAAEVTEKLRGQISDLKYHIPNTGCYPRAHYLGQRLQDLGVEAGKVWSEPSFLIGKIQPILNGQTERGAQMWERHVAPFFYVKRDGKLEEHIVDFSISDKALSMSDYASKLSPRPYWLSVQFGNRFAYDQRERWNVKTYYNGHDSAAAQQELKCIEQDLKNGTRSCGVIDSRY